MNVKIINGITIKILPHSLSKVALCCYRLNQVLQDSLHENSLVSIVKGIPQNGDILTQRKEFQNPREGPPQDHPQSYDRL